MLQTAGGATGGQASVQAHSGTPSEQLVEFLALLDRSMASQTLESTAGVRQTPAGERQSDGPEAPDTAVAVTEIVGRVLVNVEVQQVPGEGGDGTGSRMPVDSDAARGGRAAETEASPARMPRTSGDVPSTRDDAVTQIDRRVREADAAGRTVASGRTKHVPEGTPLRRVISVTAAREPSADAQEAVDAIRPRRIPSGSRGSENASGEAGRPTADTTAAMRGSSDPSPNPQPRAVAAPQAGLSADDLQRARALPSRGGGERTRVSQRGTPPTADRADVGRVEVTATGTQEAVRQKAPAVRVAEPETLPAGRQSRDASTMQGAEKPAPDWTRKDLSPIQPAPEAPPASARRLRRTPRRATPELSPTPDAKARHTPTAAQASAEQPGQHAEAAARTSQVPDAPPHASSAPRQNVQRSADWALATETAERAARSNSAEAAGTAQPRAQPPTRKQRPTGDTRSARAMHISGAQFAGARGPAAQHAESGANVQPTVSIPEANRLSRADLTADQPRRLTVEVDPPHLGRCELELSLDRGRIHATVITERSETASALRAAEDQIREQLAARDLQVARFEVGDAGGRPGPERAPHAPRESAPQSPRQDMFGADQQSGSGNGGRQDQPRPFLSTGAARPMMGTSPDVERSELTRSRTGGERVDLIA